MREKGPWKVLDSKTVYENKWIKVVEDKVIRPDGKEGIYGTVEILAGVQILPIDDNGDVYLNKEYMYAVEKEVVHVCSGCIDKGEEPLDAAKRELKEELGIEAEEWIQVGKEEPLLGLVKCPQTHFIARGLKIGEDDPEATEKITKVKMSLEEAEKLVDEGKITHSSSIILIKKAKEILLKEVKKD